jgi:hypothetical protein
VLAVIWPAVDDAGLDDHIVGVLGGDHVALMNRDLVAVGASAALRFFCMST